MALFISWRNLKNYKYITLFLSISVILQLFIMALTYYSIPISSYYILLIVPMGVILIISAAMLIFSDFIYQYIYIKRQNKISQSRDMEFTPPSKPFIIIISAIVIGLIFLLINLLFSYILIDPVAFHGIPIFAQFTISQTLSALVVILVIFVLKELQGAKKLL
ncbi:MAG: hypothetical protein EU549_04815 [Promethearchaeota archaeon]|nr:MAG: hypothetical protein EU549_04815 [Candidatus Lokiarchaeota archaeon]